METKNIKECWRQVKLGDIVKWTTGKLDSNAMVENGIYPYFTCSQETFRINEYAFDQEAVLLGGNNAAGIFPLKYYKGKFNAYQRTYVMSAIDNEVLDNKYLYYALIPELISFKNMSTGATTKFLTKGILDNFEITLPLIQIQKYIAGFLSNYDNLIENNNRRIQILEQTAQEIYKEWFVNFRFPGHETIKMIDSRTDFGRTPENWEIKSIGERFSTVLGGTPSRNNYKYWGGNIPWINSGKVNELRIMDESEFITEEGYQKSSTKLMPINTTVLAITGATLGQVSFTTVEVCANQSVVGIFDKDKYCNNYIYCFITNCIDSIVNHAGGGAQQHINKDIVNDVQILIPPLEIINEFNQVVNNIFTEITLLSKQNKNLKTSRDLLLPKLISGEIDVSELEVI